MTKAETRYPAGELQPTMPLVRATVCAVSNHLATTGCNAAGTAYEVTLPDSRVPQTTCEIHGGPQTEFAQKLEDTGRKAGALPNRILQSFRKFFGGK